MKGGKWKDGRKEWKGESVSKTDGERRMKGKGGRGKREKDEDKTVEE